MPRAAPARSGGTGYANDESQGVARNGFSATPPARSSPARRRDRRARLAKEPPMNRMKPALMLDRARARETLHVARRGHPPAGRCGVLAPAVRAALRRRDEDLHALLGTAMREALSQQ
jgi:hypothetical protein